MKASGGGETLTGATARRTDDAFDASLLRHLLVSLVALKLAGVILIVDVGGFQAFDFPKSLFSRGVAWLLAGVLVAALVRYGHGILPRSPLHVAVGLFLAAGVVSAIFAEDRYIAVFGDRESYEGLTYLGDMLVLYLATAVGFRSRSDWALLAAVLLVATMLAVAYAAVQRLGLDPLGWTQSPEARPFSTFGNPDYFGHFLSSAFGSSVAAIALGGRSVPVIVRLAGVGTGMVVLAAAAVVATRGSLLAVAAVLAVLPALYTRWDRGRLRAAGAAGTGIVVSGALIALVVMLTPLGERVRTLGLDASVQVRFMLWETAFDAFAARPLVGYGPDAFAVAFAHHRPPGSAAVLGAGALENSAHNWLLHTAATTGGVGLVALLALLATFVISAWRSTRGGSLVSGVALLGAIGYWSHGLVSVGSVSLDWLPWLALGAVASVTPRLSTPARPMGMAQAAALVLVAGVATFGAYSGLEAFQANREAGLARAIGGSDVDGALVSARSAVRRDPGRAEYRALLGDVLILRGEWHPAAAAYREATARAPHVWTHWADLAGSYRRAALSADAVATDADAALAAAERATNIDRNEPSAHVALAENAYALGRFDVALAAAIHALSIYPAPAYEEVAIRAAARVADRAYARRSLEKALSIKESALLHLSLAQLALDMREIDAARAHARRALALAPNSAEAQRILGVTGP